MKKEDSCCCQWWTRTQEVAITEANIALANGAQLPLGFLVMWDSQRCGRKLETKGWIDGKCLARRLGRVKKHWERMGWTVKARVIVRRKKTGLEIQVSLL